MQPKCLISILDIEYIEYLRTGFSLYKDLNYFSGMLVCPATCNLLNVLLLLSISIILMPYSSLYSVNKTFQGLAAKLSYFFMFFLSSFSSFFFLLFDVHISKLY